MNYEKALKEESLNLFSSAKHTNVECPLHIHSKMEIILVSDGVLNMNVSGINYEISACEAIFVPPFIPHSFSSPKRNTCHVLMFSEKLVPDFFEYLKYNSPETHLFKASNEVLILSERLLPDALNTVDSLIANAVLYPLIVDIKNTCTFGIGQTLNDDLFIEIINYLNKHYSEIISLASVAKALGVHPVTISKKFSAEAHISFTKYLNYIRSVKAVEQLATNNQTITEIANSCGFGSIRNFNRVFLENFGIPPREFKALPDKFLFPMHQ